MTLGKIVSATRTGVGLFDMTHRGLLEVRGDDRVRWLDGMISGDVLALENAALGEGCYATLLTSRGAIVADLHVARFDDSYLLESLASEIKRIRETLERYVIADDVVLSDRSDGFATLGIEGPGASTLLDSVTQGAIADLAQDCWVQAMIADRNVLIAAFGFSGESAYQLRCAPGDRESVEHALMSAGRDDLVRGTTEALEVLRVEAGIPALGAELDEEVLPPEARLERAISTTKGCYIGQEIVARLRARGQVNHLLVGFRSASSPMPKVGAEVSIEGRKTGELTSVVSSPTQGPIALGYVRREHAIDGTAVEIEGGPASVADLPFIRLRASEGSPPDAGVT